MKLSELYALLTAELLKGDCELLEGGVNMAYLTGAYPKSVSGLVKIEFERTEAGVRIYTKPDYSDREREQLTFMIKHLVTEDRDEWKPPTKKTSTKKPTT